jgi:hypothetical protein
MAQDYARTTAMKAAHMTPTWRDRITPTAAGLVSRAWVITLVAQTDLAAHEQQRLVDTLCEYEAPRRHAMRNNLIFWMGCFALAMLSTALGLPGWLGFGVGTLGFLAVARTLADRTLRWRLDRLLQAMQS